MSIVNAIQMLGDAMAVQGLKDSITIRLSHSDFMRIVWSKEFSNLKLQPPPPSSKRGSRLVFSTASGELAIEAEDRE